MNSKKIFLIYCLFNNNYEKINERRLILETLNILQNVSKYLKVNICWDEKKIYHTAQQKIT